MTTISSAIQDLEASPADRQTLRIMDPQAGDLKIMWASGNADEVSLAKDQFAAAKKKGLVAYRVNRKGDKAEVLKDFDPEAEAIIMAPPVAGG